MKHLITNILPQSPIPSFPQSLNPSIPHSLIPSIPHTSHIASSIIGRFFAHRTLHKTISVFFLISLCSLWFSSLSAQSYINWQLVYGDQLLDEDMEAIALHPSNGYITVGAHSTTPSFVNYNTFVMRIDSSGNLLGTTSIGGESLEHGQAITALPNGDVIIISTSLTISPDVPFEETIEVMHTNSDSTTISQTFTTTHHADYDLQVVYLQDDGMVKWVKNFGGNGEDNGWTVITTPDNHIWIAGESNSEEGIDLVNRGRRDMWLLELDMEGHLLHQYSYGGVGNDAANALVYDETNNELITVGYSSSTDGDISEAKGGKDYWITRINPITGELVWEKSYGGSAGDVAKDVLLLPNGDLFISGDTFSDDGDITEHFGIFDDWWVLRITPNGTIKWQRTLGTESYDNSYGIALNPNPLQESVMVMGATFDGDPAPPVTFYDTHFIELNINTGEVLSEEDFGGSQWDFGKGMVVNEKGHYVVAGFSDSKDGDVGKTASTATPRHGADDIWIFELAPLSVGINNTPNMPSFSVQISSFSQQEVLLQINGLNNLSNGIVKIYDVQGRLLQENLLNSKEQVLDMEMASSGVYLVEVCVTGECVVERILYENW